MGAARAKGRSRHAQAAGHNAHVRLVLVTACAISLPPHQIRTSRFSWAVCMRLSIGSFPLFTASMHMQIGHGLTGNPGLSHPLRSVFGL